MRLGLVAAYLLRVVVAAEPETEVCALEPLEASYLASVETIASETLSKKVSGQIVSLLESPCVLVRQGLVIMTLKMKNTASPLAAFVGALLDKLEPRAVAHAWTLFPAEPRHWMLTAFLASLPCKVAAGSRECTETATNELLAKFERARFEFTQKALTDAGMEPFAVAADEPAQEEAAVAARTGDDEVRHAIAQYATRLGFEDGPQADWLVEEFSSSSTENGNVTMAEPEWFEGVAARCRQHAHARAPGAAKPDATDDIADLVAAARAAEWGWHYQNCHKTAVLAAYDAAAPSHAAEL